MTLSPLLTELEFTTPQKEAEMGSGPKVSPPPTNVAFKIGSSSQKLPLRSVGSYQRRRAPFPLIAIHRQKAVRLRNAETNCTHTHHRLAPMSSSSSPNTPCRANANPQTFAAPASFSASAHADIVLPVVTTSSISI